MNTVIYERGSIASLVEIWCECFGDSPDVPTEFYSNVKADILVAEEDGKTVGVVNILPVTLGEYVGGYVYAAGVKNDFRGRGIFDRLLNETDSLLKKKGADFVCLVPGDESLAKTYTKRGYTEKTERLDPKKPKAVGGAVIVSEKDFSEFATPDGEEKYDFDAVCPYGLLKPLSDRFAVTEAIRFAWFMGEA